jgi:hypothetical protein
MTTIRDILFGDVLPGNVGPPAEKIEAAAERLTDAGAVPQRREAPPAAIARTVMSKVADVLDFPVNDVLVGAWRTRSALLEAARETVGKPDAHKEVTLKNYSFGWDHGVDVDVTFNHKTIATVSVVAAISVDITGLVAVVRNGRIAELTSGEMTVSASLTVSSNTVVPLSRPLAEGKRTLPVLAEVTLPNGGLPLVHQPAEASRPS